MPTSDDRKLGAMSRHDMWEAHEKLMDGPVFHDGIYFCKCEMALEWHSRGDVSLDGKAGLTPVLTPAQVEEVAPGDRLPHEYLMEDPPGDFEDHAADAWNACNAEWRRRLLGDTDADE